MPDIQNNFVQSKMNQDLDDRLIRRKIGLPHIVQNLMRKKKSGQM